MKKLVGYGVGIAVILALTIAFTMRPQASHAVITDPPACVASADVQCPTADFLAQVSEFKALQKTVAQLEKSPTFLEVQAKNDQLTGMNTRLASMVPKGFVWNDAQWHFDRIPVPALAPTDPHPSQK